MARRLSVDVLLDSVVVIDHLNGIDAASQFLHESDAKAAISVITRAEVLAGLDEDETPLVTRFLDLFPVLVLDAPTADLAASLRREHGWKLPDAIQAALAVRYGLRLATRNTRDFPPHRHPFVWIPYEV